MTRAGRTAALTALALLPLAALAAAVARQEFRDAIARTPDATHGQQLFEGSCRACHGPEGQGVEDGSVPAIAGQHQRVLVKQLVDFRNRQRWDIRMEHFADRRHLPGAQDLADLAGFISGLTPRPSRAGGSGEYLRQGASVYFESCERCHGSSGQGNGAALIPRLAGQHFDYLVRQIRDSADGRRPNMSVDHVRLVGEMDRQDILGVADYLSRLGPPAAR